jgi:hypothetical protein
MSLFWIFVCVFVSLYVCMCVCVFLYVLIFAFFYLFVYAWKTSKTWTNLIEQKQSKYHHHLQATKNNKVAKSSQ